jgi:hypothetical protein
MASHSEISNLLPLAERFGAPLFFVHGTKKAAGVREAPAETKARRKKKGLPTLHML